MSAQTRYDCWTVIRSWASTPVARFCNTCGVVIPAARALVGSESILLTPVESLHAANSVTAPRRASFIFVIGLLCMINE